MTEHDTQNAIIQLITARGGLPIRINSGKAIIKRDGGNQVIMGADKGTSDIIALYHGRFLAIEVKYGKNKPTREQQQFIWDVRDRGGIGVCVWDVDSVIFLLDAIDKGTALDTIIKAMEAG